MPLDDEEDWDTEEYVSYDDPMPSPGVTIWSVLWIVADATCAFANAIEHVAGNIKADLVHRHNQEIEEKDFAVTVSKGIEAL